MTPWESGFEGYDGGTRVPTGLEQEPTSQLIGELVSEAKHLVREEVRIAKAEIRHDVKEATIGASLLGMAAVVGNGAFLALVASVVLLLSLFLPAWLAAAGVGVLLLSSAGILAGIGKERLSHVGLDRTISTVKEDGQWASETMRATGSSSRGTA